MRKIKVFKILEHLLHVKTEIKGESSKFPKSWTLENLYYTYGILIISSSNDQHCVINSK